MKKAASILSLTFGLAVVFVILGHAAEGPSFAPPPPWAYGYTTPPPPGPPPSEPAKQQPAPPNPNANRAPVDNSLKSVPGSKYQFTLAQIRDGFTIADWFPEDHPTPPNPVLKGRQPDLRACGLCHYPNGKGRPENAGVSGLAVEYVVRQLRDFRNDRRWSADPRKTNTSIMIGIAKALTEEEIPQVAEYFASVKWQQPWITVKEADMVPATRSAGGMFLRLEPEKLEPIGNRIIETPVDTDMTETLRNPRSGFVAYVPPGSIKKGLQLMMSGVNGTVTKCFVCHGDDLKGIGPIPSIAGRSPSYIVRQLYDIKVGTRKGSWVDLMKPIVEKLTDDDMLNLAAFASSKTP
jgi:cytochrome c553